MKTTKDFRFLDVKANAVTPGGFTGRASVYGVVDAYNDVVMPGAFTNHLREHGNRVPVLNQHNPSDPIGWAVLTDSPAALLATGSLLLEVQSAKDMYVRLQNGVIDGISIGYEVAKDRMVNGVRQLHEIKLWEISLVTFPANALARVTDVKHLDEAAGLRRLSAHVREITAALQVDYLRGSLAELKTMVHTRQARLAAVDARISQLGAAKASGTLTGTVGHWSVSNGTGYVNGDNGRPYVIPLGALDGTGVNQLFTGQRIEFELADAETVLRVLRLIPDPPAKSYGPRFTGYVPLAPLSGAGLNIAAELKGRR